MPKPPKQNPDRPHPRREPRIPLPLSLENLGRVFDRCADYQTRTVCLAGAGERTLTVCYIDGMARTERLNDYVLRPLAQDERLARVPEGELLEYLRQGDLYAQQVHRRTQTWWGAAAPCSFRGRGRPSLFRCPRRKNARWGSRRTSRL